MAQSFPQPTLDELDAEIADARLRLANAASLAQASAYWLDLRDLCQVRDATAALAEDITIEEELARR